MFCKYTYGNKTIDLKYKRDCNGMIQSSQQAGEIATLCFTSILILLEINVLASPRQL